MLNEILDKVKASDREEFRTKIEAKEAESLHFLHGKGEQTLDDIMEKRLQNEQMVFQVDEDYSGEKPKERVTPKAAPEVAPDSDVYKAFLNQLK